MNDSNGLTIEGFAVCAYKCMFGDKIDRHHPLLSWAGSNISSNPEDFAATKANVILAFDGVVHTLYYARCQEALTALGDLESLLKEAQSLQTLVETIHNARPQWERAFRLSVV